MGYSSWGRKESDMTEHTHTHPGGLQFLGSQRVRHDWTHTHTPWWLQFLGSQKVRHDWTHTHTPWWATVPGVAGRQTRLHAHAHTHEVEKSKIQAPANLARREGLLSSLHLATTSPWVHVTCSLHTHSTQVPVPLLVRISNLITGTRLSWRHLTKSS